MMHKRVDALLRALGVGGKHILLMKLHRIGMCAPLTLRKSEDEGIYWNTSWVWLWKDIDATGVAADMVCTDGNHVPAVAALWYSEVASVENLVMHNIS